MASQPRFQAVPRYDFQGLNLLVVEDHEDSRELLIAILEGFGAKVLAAATAEAGFQLARSQRFDVILSDIGLPGEDGHSFLRRVRALPAHEGGSTPAIAVTAFATLRDRREALAAGFDTYLSKPVDVARLCESIERLVANPTSMVRPAPSNE